MGRVYIRSYDLWKYLSNVVDLQYNLYDSANQCIFGRQKSPMASMESGRIHFVAYLSVVDLDPSEKGGSVAGKYVGSSICIIYSVYQFELMER